MAHGRFVTAINCMDGRTQEPVAAWMKRQFGADYVDTITEPGPDRILADGPPELIESIRRRVKISVRAHGSRVLALVAHDDCAGNLVSRGEHLQQLEKAGNRILNWDLPGLRLLTVFVDEGWGVEVISDTGA